MAETVHNRIAMLRAERKVSRRELADALGVHYQTIGYLERGEYSPSLYLALPSLSTSRFPPMSSSPSANSHASDEVAAAGGGPEPFVRF